MASAKTGGYSVKLDLPKSAYISALSVYPKHSVTVLHVSNASSQTSMLASGGQSVTLTVPANATSYVFNNLTPADWERCMKTIDHTRCDQGSGYIVVVASEVPFDTGSVAKNLSTVDLVGSTAQVIKRVADAVAQSTAAPWGAASSELPAQGIPLRSPFGIPISPRSTFRDHTVGR